MWAAQAIVSLPGMLAARGDIDALRAVYERLGGLSDWDPISVATVAVRAIVLRETGEAGGSIEAAIGAILRVLPRAISDTPPLFAEVVDCCYAAGRPEATQELLDGVEELKPAELTPLLDAEASRARAKLAAHHGSQEDAEQLFRRAIGLFRELATPFYQARAQLEYAELLSASGQEAEAPLGESEEIFERLAARPWLDRAHALRPAVAA